MGNLDKYDMLKYELFECLLPGMLYTGSMKEKVSFIEELERDEENLIRHLLAKMCEEDGVPYAFEEDAFQIQKFEQGGIHFIEIEIPQSNPRINYVLRAYILYANERVNESRIHWRYFLVKRFYTDGKIHVLYVSPDREILLGDELTGDKEHEHRCLARTFLSVMVEEMGVVNDQ